MNLIDPTEGIRSSEIIPVMQEYFKIIERKDFGGSILHLLLNDIAGNFTDPGHKELIVELIKFEEDLIKSGKLQSDFAYWVATRRS